MAVPFELILFITGLGMIFVGFAMQKLRIFKTMGSILLIVLTVVILGNGIAGVDNLTTVMIGSICFAIGMISLITDNFSKEKQKENFDWNEEEDDGRFHDND
jgi:hypothetical protein